jgi:hypothetical protein
MTKQEVYSELKRLWEEFDKNHNSTTKAGASRARKALGDLKNLITPYRKASVSEDKGV